MLKERANRAYYAGLRFMRDYILSKSLLSDIFLMSKNLRILGTGKVHALINGIAY